MFILKYYAFINKQLNLLYNIINKFLINNCKYLNLFK